MCAARNNNNYLPMAARHNNHLPLAARRYNNNNDNRNVAYDQWDPRPWCAWAHRGHRLWASMTEYFWVHIYKSRPCVRPRRHPWSTCPYAHPGERARRRDPRRVVYAAALCPNYHHIYGDRCSWGPHCELAHGPFELWLHPARFRTEMCLAGPRCPRPVCFFAHSAAELRYEGRELPIGGVPVPPRSSAIAAGVIPRWVELATASEADDMAANEQLCMNESSPAGASASSSGVPARREVVPAVRRRVPSEAAWLSSDDDGTYSGANSGRYTDEETILSDNDYKYIDHIVKGLALDD